MTDLLERLLTLFLLYLFAKRYSVNKGFTEEHFVNCSPLWKILENTTMTFLLRLLKQTKRAQRQLIKPRYQFVTALLSYIVVLLLYCLLITQEQTA